MSIFDTLFKPKLKYSAESRTVTCDDLHDNDDSEYDDILHQLSKILDDDTQCAIDLNADLNADMIENWTRWTVTFKRANIFLRSDEINNKDVDIRIAFCDGIECKTLKNLRILNRTDTNFVETTQIEVDVYE